MVFVALPIIHLVIFLIDKSATKTLQEAESPHTWLIWSCCSLFVSRFYTQLGIVSCTYPIEFILAGSRCMGVHLKKPQFIYFATFELHTPVVKIWSRTVSGLPFITLLFPVSLLVWRPNQMCVYPHHCIPSNNTWILLLIYATCQKLGGQLFSWRPHYSPWTFTRYQ